MRLALAEGEQVILHERPSGHSLFWPILRLFAAGIGLGWLLGQLKPLLESVEATAGQAAKTVLLAVLVLLSLWMLYVLGLRRVRRWLSTHYILTTERLIVRHGSRRRNEMSYPLTALYRVDIAGRWYQRMTDSGILRFAVSQGGEFGLKDVPNAPVFRSEILDAVSKAQQRHWQPAPAYAVFGQGGPGYGAGYQPFPPSPSSGFPGPGQTDFTPGQAGYYGQGRSTPGGFA